MLADPLTTKYAETITSVGSAKSFVLTTPANSKYKEYTREATAGDLASVYKLRTTSVQSGNLASQRRIAVSLQMTTTVVSTGVVKAPVLVSFSVLYDTGNATSETDSLAMIRDLAFLLAASAEPNILSRLFDGEY